MLRHLGRGFVRRFSTGTSNTPPPTPQEALEFLTDVTSGAKGLPRAAMYQSMIGNQMTKFYLRTACPGVFDQAEQDVPRGAIAGLELLPASLSSDEFMTVLGQCAEKKFFNQYRQAVSVLGSEQIQWKLDRVNSASLDTMFGIIGAQRGDSMKGKQFMELLGQHFVVSPEFAAAIKLQDFKERATKSLPFLFADGAMIRVRVMLDVDQTVCLPSWENEQVVQGKPEAQKNVNHLMTLEISLTPRIGKKQLLSADSLMELTAEDPMTAGDWLIADVNFSLSDNYPLEPPVAPKEDGEDEPPKNP
jgi:hypothetical protein